eukprot:TRINITY_DN9860_c0_g1_i6.p1 TRINITY_DN9860_c0_g1~~TRINITY_DN9860_c0_g1_i6.p1  ORF type:complete len:498 (+),score=42.78 TRINITY_DN9860_c0_g1_i6:71-1495(+)
MCIRDRARLMHFNMKPRRVNELNRKVITDISCNQSAVLLLSQEGMVYAWGSDNDGMGVLGLGPTKQVVTPTRLIGFARGITEVSLGEKHACAVDMDGGLYTWGTGYLGELGCPDTEILWTPYKVEINDILAVKTAKCSETMTCFVTNGGHVYFLGQFQASEAAQKLKTLQLIDHAKTRINIPQLIEGLTQHFIDQIALDSQYLVALSNHGELFVVKKGLNITQLNPGGPLVASFSIIKKTVVALTKEGHSLVRWRLTSNFSEIPSLTESTISSFVHNPYLENQGRTTASVVIWECQEAESSNLPFDIQPLEDFSPNSKLTHFSISPSERKSFHSVDFERLYSSLRKSDKNNQARERAAERLTSTVKSIFSFNPRYHFSSAKLDQGQLNLEAKTIRLVSLVKNVGFRRAFKKLKRWNLQFTVSYHRRSNGTLTTSKKTKMKNLHVFSCDAMLLGIDVESISPSEMTYLSTSPNQS